MPLDLKPASVGDIDQRALPADVQKLLEKPNRILCNVDMRIDVKGKWFHEGGVINRHRLVKLFSHVLYRDDDGDHWLVTPVEVAPVCVEDAPFVALELIDGDINADGEPVLKLRTNVDDVVPLDEDHPIRIEINAATGEPRPYIRVRDRLEALIARSVFYQLIEKSDEIDVDGSIVMGVWSAGVFLPLGDTAVGTPA